jgi:hypothetical protein
MFQCGMLWVSYTSSQNTVQRPKAYNNSFNFASSTDCESIGFISYNVTGESNTGPGRETGLLYGINLQNLPPGKDLLSNVRLPVLGRRGKGASSAHLLDTRILVMACVVHLPSTVLSL